MKTFIEVNQVLDTGICVETSININKIEAFIEHSQGLVGIVMESQSAYLIKADYEEIKSRINAMQKKGAR